MIKQTPIAVGGKITDELTQQAIASQVTRWISKHKPLPEGAELFPMFDSGIILKCDSTPETRQEARKAWHYCFFIAGVRIGSMVDTINAVGVSAIAGNGRILYALYDEEKVAKKLALLDEGALSLTNKGTMQWQKKDMVKIAWWMAGAALFSFIWLLA